MRALIIFTKVPQLGHIKTRFKPGFTDEQILSLYKAFLFDAIEKFKKHKPIIAYHPPSLINQFRLMLGVQSYLPQRGKNLGERMANAAEDLYSQGATDVVIIGADSPTLPPEFIDQAFNALTGSDVVLGPSQDGGYYLIGGRLDDSFFEGVGWGGESALSQTMANLEKVGKTHHLLPGWYDVDTSEDMERLSRDERLSVCPKTKKVLDDILSETS